MAGPPDRHGPAHRLAPLDRLHPVLDCRCCTRPSSCSATPASTDLPVFGQFLDLAGVTASLLGMCAAGHHHHRRRRSRSGSPAAACRTRPGTRFTSLLYAAIVLALIHQLLRGHDLQSRALTTAYWWTLWALAVAALIVGRVVMPLWRNARHQFRVAAVVPESDNVVSVHVTGRHLDRLPARAGQFFIWRFLGHNRWWQANPFSLSAAPDGQSLRLTAKAVGTTSAGLRHVPVGTRVFAEGPYGAFTALHADQDATLLIAGGVGITPIRALLEELTGSVVVLYRVHTHGRRRAARRAAGAGPGRGGAQLHVLTGRTGAGSPPNDPFAPHNLVALVPDITDRDVFVCGPPPMTSAVLRSLRALGVPRRQVHAERFSLAG